MIQPGEFHVNPSHRSTPLWVKSLSMGEMNGTFTSETRGARILHNSMEAEACGDCCIDWLLKHTYKTSHFSNLLWNAPNTLQYVLDPKVCKTIHSANNTIYLWCHNIKFQIANKNKLLISCFIRILPILEPHKNVQMSPKEKRGKASILYNNNNHTVFMSGKD